MVKLLYVAATRSKKGLYFTYPSMTTNQQYGKVFIENPSRYLFPILPEERISILYKYLNYPQNSNSRKNHTENKGEDIDKQIIKLPFFNPDERQISTIKQVGFIDPKYL